MPDMIIQVKRHATKEELKELRHHGIKNMRWGRRRFQNEDGSLTEAGRKRYGVGDSGSKSESNALPSPKSTPALSSPKSEERGLVPANRLPVPAKSKSSTDQDTFDKADTIIKDAPKTDSGNSSKTSRPKDIYDDSPMTDKTSNTKRSDAKKAREEAEKERNAKKREREAEKNKREEEAAKKENEKERKENALEKKQEEAEKERNAKKREREAEKNKREEEAEESKADRKKRLKEDNDLASEEEKWNKNFDPETIKRQREIERCQTAKSVTGDIGTISREAGNIAYRNRPNVPRMDLRHMTTQQLNDAVARDIAESNYDARFNRQRLEANARAERTKNFFDNVGSAVTIAGAALGIAVAIKQLRS